MRRRVTTWAVVLGWACGSAGPTEDDDTDDTDEVVEVVCEPAPIDLDWSERTTGHERLAVDYTVPWSGAARSIGVEVWYPTDATVGEPATYSGFSVDAFALTGAAFADPAPGCKLPLVVYSHGSQSWGGSAGTLLRHLVAQGWVAAAPDHTGNLLLGGEGPHPRSFSLLRVEDVRRAIDAVEQLPEGHPLAGRVDTDRVLVVGHSYGAQTAWLMAGPTYNLDGLEAGCAEPPCEEGSLDAFAAATADPRVIAVMPLDGTVGDDIVAAEGWNDVTLPVFAQSREGENFEQMFARASGADVTWVSIEGSCHESFTGNPIPCATLAKDEGLSVVGTYLGAFAARQVLGQDDAALLGILDGTTEVSPKVTMERSR